MMISGTIVESTIDFLQRLIQTPSMSCEEAAIAELVAEECLTLGFDEAGIDGKGNVLKFRFHAVNQWVI